MAEVKIWTNEHGIEMFRCPNCRVNWPYVSLAYKYHLDGSCLAMRRLTGVMIARERNGVNDHTGLVVDGIEIQREL